MILGQYTDEDVVIDVDGCDLNDIHGLHVTFQQGGTTVDVTDVIILNNSRLVVPLSQIQTGSFNAHSPVSVQLNFFNQNGKRKKSDTVKIDVDSNLLRRIIND